MPKRQGNGDYYGGSTIIPGSDFGFSKLAPARPDVEEMWRQHLGTVWPAFVKQQSVKKKRRKRHR